MSYLSKNTDIFATISEALNKQTVEQLKQILPHLSAKERPTRKAEIIALIEQHLQGEKLQSLWRKLDSLQQAAVAEVVHSQGCKFEAGRFQAKYGELPNFGVRSSYGTQQSTSALGLFFYGKLMPLELKQRLLELVPPPVLMKLKSNQEIGAAIEQHWQEFNYETRQRIERVRSIPLEQGLRERSATQELLAVLRLIDLGKVSVSDKTRFPSAATLKSLTSVLEGGDYYTDIYSKENPPTYQEIGSLRAFGWAMLVQAGGLAELSGKKLTLTKAGKKALSAPPEPTLKHIWKKWQKTKILDEFRRINAIKGQTGKGQRSMTAVEERREAFALALSDCPVNQWVEVDEFFRYMQGSSIYEFEVTRNPWNLYICEAEYGSLGYEGFHEWSMLQGRYILCLLFEYAATLGMVDVAYISPVGARKDYLGNWGVDDLEFLSRYDGLSYFRLTSLGAYCLNLEAHYTGEPLTMRPVLRVLPNQEIVAVSDSLSAADVLALDLYGQKVSDVVWRLDLTKLLKAVAEGRSVEELAEFLKTRTAEPLPPTVEQFLADVKSRTGSLKDGGSGRIIECSDPALAALIAHDSRTKKYCFLAGESRLVVPFTKETKFRNALQKLGYTLPQ